MSAIAGVRTLERSLLVYRRAWRGSFFETVLSPILYLSALGVGLGSLITSTESLGGVSYLAFLAPGLLAAQAMQTCALESAWPLLASFRWTRTFEAMLGTPQGVRDIVLGHLYWLIARTAMVTGIFLVVMVLFGAVTWPTFIFAWPAAILTGLAFGMPMAAWTATRRTEVSLSVIFRVVVTPLFIFSGTFFPVTEMPELLQAVAWLSPLFHGVELTRALTTGQLGDPLLLAFHAVFLVALAVAGTLVALRTFQRRLVF